MALMRRPIRQAFTLIELLVVIAIIAILTAILLPVFASVREGARQGTSISNMKDIQQKMEQFKLDNHRYPDVLFGYADGQGNMKGALGRAQAYDTAHGTHTAALYFPGLYPAYIKDVEEFTDPNNTVNTSDFNQTTYGYGDNNSVTHRVAVNLIYPCSASSDMVLSGASSSPCTPPNPPSYGPGAVVGSFRSFYGADAYDSSPTVTGTNQISNPASYLIRYQIAREGTACNSGAPLGCDPSVQAIVKNQDGTTAAYQPYTHQLRWQNPPSDTVIIATTYHVKNADKVLVMFESGAVKKITGHDFAAKEGAGSFWQITP